MAQKLVNEKFLPGRLGVPLVFSTRAPTSSDRRYDEGTIWVDRENDEAYILVDLGSTPGSATWNSIALSLPVPVADGGTGHSSYTDGQLLIGNSTGNTLDKATLTQGDGMTITNGGGAITLKANFDAPPTIGDVTPADATFTDVDMMGISGSYTDSEVKFRQDGLTTTDNVQQTLSSVALNVNEMVSIECRINAFRGDQSEGFSARIFAAARRAAGSIVLVGTPIIDQIEDSSGALSVDVDADAGGTEALRILVTGEIGKTFYWVSAYQYHKTLTNA